MTDLPPQHDLAPQPATEPRRTAQFALVALVVAVALLGAWTAVQTGRGDTALLFVGVPTLLALGLVFLPTRGGWGSLFQAVTLVLLLVSALMHEGAICVLIASPLVYGVTAAIYGSIRLARSATQRQYSGLPLAVIAVLALEGTVPGLRVDPEQRAEATTSVPAGCAAFEQALRRGPRPQASDRSRLLDLTGYATPVAATGDGLSIGDHWTLTFAAGAIDTEVTDAAPGRVDFTVLDDTSKTARFVRLRTGTLTWRATQGTCEVQMIFDYERKLDPSLWFGPITDRMMDAGAAAFLHSLAR
ncbi:hypothetical protein [Nocardioides acrostichi]|uniref:Uncharacterized protein n=1 Tax=Nocardioides acrostichi TaxID=2784339 RepID=A0A930UUT0_9ACTN|nr:hypothetical protein [Nocardioides acrostichi]MBF4161248.1 hypothetical protein [Nocardioides acrostichi]